MRIQSNLFLFSDPIPSFSFESDEEFPDTFLIRLRPSFPKIPCSSMSELCYLLTKPFFFIFSSDGFIFSLEVRLSRGGIGRYRWTIYTFSLYYKLSRETFCKCNNPQMISASFNTLLFFKHKLLIIPARREPFTIITGSFLFRLWKWSWKLPLLCSRCWLKGQLRCCTLASE